MAFHRVRIGTDGAVSGIPELPGRTGLHDPAALIVEAGTDGAGVREAATAGGSTRRPGVFSGHQETDRDRHPFEVELPGCGLMFEADRCADHRPCDREGRLSS